MNNNGYYLFSCIHFEVHFHIQLLYNLLSIYVNLFYFNCFILIYFILGIMRFSLN